MLVSELLDKYEREVVPQRAPRTQIDYKWHIARLKDHFGHKDVNELEPRDVGQFLDVPTGKICRNRSVAVLSAAYSKAVGKWWLAKSNPCLKVERNESHHRTRYITDAEYKAVYDIMPDRMQIAMDLALLTGQRQGDLLKLTWMHALPDGVFFQQGKTGKKIIVDLSPALRAVMVRARRLPPQIPRMHLIRTECGNPFTSEGFRANWQRYMRKAIKLGVIKERFTFHDIRAKCVSDTENINDAMNRAGHTNMSMTRSVYDRAARRVSALR